MLWDFLWNTLDYWQRETLLPRNMRRVWGEVTVPRPMAQVGSHYTVRYLLADDWYTRDWRALERGKLPPRYRYRHFSVPKADGTLRHLAEPGVDLKAMQHRIIENILRRDKPHRTAMGYRRGMSIADHAWAHAGAQTIITADIADFFPSTSRYRVRQFWAGHQYGFDPVTITLLTNLTTYRGSLPQGAPTSPVLSNLVNRDLDARLAKLAAETGGRYTRYADDMAFSWQMRGRPPADFEAHVRRVLREAGYRLHPRKGWQVWSRGDEPEITGVVLKRDGRVDVPPAMLATMRELARQDPTHPQLAGYEGYRQMVTRTRR
jgi:RNA-directed DNA polymerase